MADQMLDAVIIGAGHAGLAMSYHLAQRGMRHVVLERGNIGESWRTQRWDSFALNTPNRYNVLPGEVYTGANPDGFGTAEGFASSLEQYAHRHHLPVQDHTSVVSVKRNSSTFHVTSLVNRATRRYTCRQVVVASGGMNDRRVPAFAEGIPPAIRQCHASQYRTPSELPDGAVLVVGGAQSGLQIAEDLIDAGRSVFLSTSAVGRVPRRYRGSDIFFWLLTIGFFDMKTVDVADPRDIEMRQPQVSGVGPLGHTLSLQSLAAKGVVIVGRIDGARDNQLRLQPNAGDHIRFGDETSRAIKDRIDQHVAAHHLDVPPPEPDPADEPDVSASCASSMSSLDLEKENVRSIVWATGFVGNFSYLEERFVGRNGRPLHNQGISPAPGLYCIGLPWLRKRKSGIIPGVAEDAAFLAELVSLHHMRKMN